MGVYVWECVRGEVPFSSPLERPISPVGIGMQNKEKLLSLSTDPDNTDHGDDDGSSGGNNGDDNTSDDDQECEGQEEEGEDDDE